MDKACGNQTSWSQSAHSQSQNHNYSIGRVYFFFVMQTYITRATSGLMSHNCENYLQALIAQFSTLTPLIFHNDMMHLISPTQVCIWQCTNTMDLVCKSKSRAAAPPQGQIGGGGSRGSAPHPFGHTLYYL